MGDLVAIAAEGHSPTVDYYRAVGQRAGSRTGAVDGSGRQAAASATTATRASMRRSPPLG